MAPVDGIEFLRIVRGSDNKAIANTRIIFLTADAQRDTVLAAKDLRVDGYLVKPVSLARLQAKLHETIVLNPELN
jgi:two-component system chemotaxis response regulator CheY